LDQKRIEKEAEQYAAARAELADLVGAMRTEQGEVKRRHLPKIRRAVARAKERREALRADVEVSPELFRKRKSQILHGIRVGFRKAKGKLTFPDAGKLVERIKKLLPEQSDRLIKTEEKPVRAELNRLDAATLRRLGVEVTADQDLPIVEPTDTEVDRVVKALIEDDDLEEAA